MTMILKYVFREMACDCVCWVQNVDDRGDCWVYVIMNMKIKVFCGHAFICKVR